MNCICWLLGNRTCLSCQLPFCVEYNSFVFQGLNVLAECCGVFPVIVFEALDVCCVSGVEGVMSQPYVCFMLIVVVSCHDSLVKYA